MYAMIPGYKKSSKTTVVFTIITAIALSLFIISAALKITLNFRPLYYWDIKHLNLVSSTNMTTAQIEKNYDALIDYSVNRDIKVLKFPTLPMSEEGRMHFSDVKRIFNFMNTMFYAALAIGIVGIIICLLKGSKAFLKWTSILSIILPVLLAIPFAINFDAVFTAFHKLFFTNDYWEFDPVKDPIINILPQQFFMHCAIMILGIMVLWSLILYIIYRVTKKERG